MKNQSYKKRNPSYNKRVDCQAAASYIGVAVQTLHNWRFQRKGPDYFKIGRRILYDTNDLDAFLESNRVNLMHKEPL